MYADGALGSRGAALLEPYSDDPGNIGLLVTPGDHMEDVSRRALAAGFQVGIHAIGDRGSLVAVDAMETALGGPRPEARFRLGDVGPCHLTDAKAVPRRLELLLQVDRRYGRGKVFRAASLDLDEAKRFSVKSDDVDLTRYLHTLCVSPDGDLEVSSNQPITALSQKYRSEPFALGTKATPTIDLESFIHSIRQDAA